MITQSTELAGIRVLGDRWDFAITVVDVAGAAVDLTGATVIMTIGTGAPKTATLADQTTQRGQAMASYLPAETLAMAYPAGGEYHWRVTVEYDANNVDTVADGMMRVTR